MHAATRKHALIRQLRVRVSQTNNRPLGFEQSQSNYARIGVRCGERAGCRFRNLSVTRLVHDRKNCVTRQLRRMLGLFARFCRSRGSVPSQIIAQAREPFRVPYVFSNAPYESPPFWEGRTWRIGLVGMFIIKCLASPLFVQCKAASCFCLASQLGSVLRQPRAFVAATSILSTISSHRVPAKRVLRSRIKHDHRNADGILVHQPFAGKPMIA